MQFIADLHLHSNYSRATSPNMNIKYLSDAAKVKGLNLLGTGDFTHPRHLVNLKKDLKISDEGMHEFNGCNFILTSEISLMYSQGGRGRKVHVLTFAPDFEVVDQINELLDSWGRRDYDGRPIFGRSCIEYADELMKISKECMLIPAHIWTPFFGVLGSESGFNSIEECFAEKSKYVSAVETGISSDPKMNWRLSSLDPYTLVSFSDSHSPYSWRLGREACVFDLKQKSYYELKEAVEKRDKHKFLYTLEVDPAYGKYHYDGHAACKVSMSPKESLAVNNICPVCHKKLTIGVEHRVEELADRPVDYVPKNAIPFKSIMPLQDIIAAVFNVTVSSKKVATEANKLIASFGSELNVLMSAPENALKGLSSDRIVKALIDNRNGTIKVKPGYDGEYGIPLIEGASSTSVHQKDISDY